MPPCTARTELSQRGHRATNLGASPRLQLDCLVTTARQASGIDEVDRPARPRPPAVREAATHQVKPVQVDQGRHQGQHGEHGDGDERHPDISPTIPPQGQHSEHESGGVRGAEKRRAGPNRDRPCEEAIGEGGHHQELVGGQQRQHGESHQHATGRRQHAADASAACPPLPGRLRSASLAATSGVTRRGHLIPPADSHCAYDRTNVGRRSASGIFPTLRRSVRGSGGELPQPPDPGS